MFVSMCFKIMSKVVKYTCRLRRYNYTQDQLNTRHFLGIFLRGGAQNSSLPPGARYPRYATGVYGWVGCMCVCMYMCMHVERPSGLNKS